MTPKLLLSAACVLLLGATFADATDAPPNYVSAYPPVPGVSPETSPPGTPRAPDWAYPDSPTHPQIPPPPDFHRATRTELKPLGIFEGQSDVGGTLVPGSATYDPATKTYAITSAGYNIFYTRDEFHFLWKKMSGDVSLAGNVSYPTDGFGDRMAVLVIRQNLDDDSKEAFLAQHGGGAFNFAWRPGKEEHADWRIRSHAYNIGKGEYQDIHYKDGLKANSRGPQYIHRIGIEKKGDSVTIWVSEQGEPMHQYGAPVTMHLDGPFYVGIGYTSHMPTVADTVHVSDVLLVNKAGAVH